MEIKTIELQEPAKISVSVAGNLYLRSWEKSELRVQGSDLDEISLVNLSNEIEISYEGDLLVSLPSKSRLNLLKVGGNAYLLGKLEWVEIGKIDGNLTLQNVKNIKAGQIGGNCKIDGLASGFSADSIDGNLKGIHISEVFTCEHVGGNVSLFAVKGATTIDAGGNMKVHLDELGGDIQLRAGGSIHLFIPENPDARFDLHNSGDSVEVGIGGKIQKLRSATFKSIYRDGKSLIKLTAGGRIKLFDHPSGQINPDDFYSGAEKLEQKFEEKFKNGDFNSFQNRIDFDLNQLDSLINENVERVTKLTEQRVKEAFEKIGSIPEWKDFTCSNWGGTVREQSDVIDQQKKTSHASEEEKLMVLKMLQEKKIDAVEAEKLLKALEGRD